MNKKHKYSWDVHPHINFRFINKCKYYLISSSEFLYSRLKIILIISLFLSISTAEIPKLLYPGKIDVFFSSTKNGINRYNLILWSPIFKGGFGSFSQQKIYRGGFFRPLVTVSNVGELIVGLQSLDVGEETQIEIQGEYRFPFGLGIGGGIVERKENYNDVKFTKLSYRNSWQGLQFIVSFQEQQTAGKNSSGGYLALYNKKLMGVLGADGEQWRGTIGYVAPKNNDIKWRPSFEILYVDNTIGNLVGPQFIFANATLGFRGGFLSHPARLGRAMGPTGLEFGNPLGFLYPTFNRRLNVWELGGIADFRVVRLELNGDINEVWEIVFFPFQMFKVGRPFASNLFIGSQYNKNEDNDLTSVGMFGYSGKIGPIVVNLHGEIYFNNVKKSIFLGLIYPF